MNVSELTLLVLRIGFLLLLWIFVFAIVYALRGDLFGARVRKLPDTAAPAPASSPAPQSAPAATQPPVPDTRTNPLAGLASTEPHRVPVKATLYTANKLVVTGGPNAGDEYALTPEPLTIGRSPESGLIIQDDYTSTHHARIMLWNDEWMLQDLDSTNGTFLDGKRITAPTPIPLDTPIKIGLTTFELRRA